LDAVSPKVFGLIIGRMSRRANREAEVGPAAIAIAVVIGLLYLYLYLGGALRSGHSPTTGAGLGHMIETELTKLQ
jgi:hypothetical protein